MAGRTLFGDRYANRDFPTFHSLQKRNLHHVLDVLALPATSFLWFTGVALLSEVEDRAEDVADTSGR